MRPRTALCAGWLLLLLGGLDVEARQRPAPPVRTPAASVPTVEADGAAAVPNGLFGLAGFVLLALGWATERTERVRDRSDRPRL